MLFRSRSEELDNDCAGFDPVGFDEARRTGGGDEDIGAPGDFRKRGCKPVADSDRGIVAGEKLRGGHADDRRAADDDGVQPADVGADRLDQAQDPGGGTGECCL